MGEDRRGTFIKIYRRAQYNEIFREKPFDRWHAFEYLLIRAQGAPKDTVIKGRTVHLERGQLIQGVDSLAEIFGWSRGKVYRFLKLLKKHRMIQYSGTPNGTLITIENYSFFQDKQSPDGTPNGTPDGTPDGTQSKKDKKDKKDKNNPPYKSPQGDGEMEAEVNQLPLEMRSTMFDFIEHRKEIKKPFTTRGLKMMIKKLSELSGGDSKTAVKIMEQSIANGWQGIFPLKEQQEKKRPRNEALEMLKAGVFENE